MKRILLFFALVAGFITTNAQTWNKVNGRWEYQYMRFDNTVGTFTPPLDTLPNAAVGSIAIKNDVLYKKGALSWGPVGVTSIPSWQQTLDVNNTAHSYTRYDTAMVGNPVTKIWAIYEPLVKTDTAAVKYYVSQFSGSNNGSYNEVMYDGWNITSGGGQMNSNFPAIGHGLESNYQINPLYPAFSDRLMEMHDIYVQRDGTQHRIASYTINTNLNTINFYHTVDNFSLHTQSHVPYYSIQGVNTSVEQSFLNPSNSNDYFNIATEFNSDVNTATLTLGSSVTKPVSVFTMANFNHASIPSTDVYGLTEDAAQVSFSGHTSGNLGGLLFDSAKMRLNAQLNVPIYFNIDGVTTMGLYKTKAQLSGPLSINNNVDIATAPFAGFESRANSSSLEAAGWFQQTYTGAGTKYGVEVYASGINGTNEGAYIAAFNGAANRSLRIQFPTAGPDNHAIYCDATAQSYFAGKIGIGSGVTNPDSTLQINGSFHNNAGVRMTGLPVNAGTKAVRIDASGNLSIADTTVGGITSINGQTGTAITVTTGTGLTTSTGSNTITVSYDVNSTDVHQKLDKKFTDANNSGTSESDLYSYTLGASKLLNNGSSIHFVASINLNDITATSQLQVYFAGTSIGNTGALTISSTGTVRISGEIIRATSTTARATVVVIGDGITTDYVKETDLTGLDFTTTNIFKITGQAGGTSGGSNDITAKSWVITYEP